MSRKICLLLLLTMSGCGTVPFRILKYPENRSETQRQLDNLECHNLSKVQGPWLFGIGNLMYLSMAKSRYQECMEKRGYLVEAE